MMENESHIMEDALEASIGARIKALRRARGITLDALSAASGVSRAMISRIERAEVSPTASLLSRLCAALGLSLSTFFANEAEAGSPLSRREAQPVWQDPETGYRRRAVSPAAIGSPVDLVEVELPPGARVLFPPHKAAEGMSQYVWLFAGSLDMRVGEILYRLAPGDCLFMPVGDGHAFFNPGGEVARYAVVLDRARAVPR